MLAMTPENRKALAFVLFNFILSFVYIVALFPTNSLLIYRVGTQSLFLVYFLSAVLEIILVGLFYLLLTKVRKLTVFYFSYPFLGLCVLICWGFFHFMPQEPAVYVLIRCFFSAIFFYNNLVFWFLASNSFTNFEAKRVFPYLVAGGTLGFVVSGFSVSLLVPVLHTVNLPFLCAFILLVILPFLLKKISTYSIPERRVKEMPALELAPKRSYLPILLFLFWIVYYFFCFGIDYIYNSFALSISVEDGTTSFFGQVIMVASFVVLIYHFFFAPRIAIRLGFIASLIAIPLMIFLTCLLLALHPTLLTVAVAEGIIFFFITALFYARINSVMALFPLDERAKVRTLTEGVGRFAGALIFLLIGLTTTFYFEAQKMIHVLFYVSAIFLIYPLLFHPIYVRHLVKCLDSDDHNLLINAIQALGEKGKKLAVKPLITLLKNTDEIDVQKTIVLSLGRIKSQEAFKDIVDLFSVRQESIQLAVLASLAHYRNYNSMFALLTLLNSKKNVSLQVRMSAVILLTKLIGKAMLPFLLTSLSHEDIRVRANAIEALGILRERGSISFILPFLADENHRIKANAAIALYQFRFSRDNVREKSVKVIDSLFHSQKTEERLAALYAIGRLKLRKYKEKLISLLETKNQDKLSLICTALAMMEDESFCDPFISLLLGPNKELAVVTAKRLGTCPPKSQMLISNRIADLPKDAQNIIYERLRDSLIDFSYIAISDFVPQEEPLKQLA